MSSNLPQNLRMPIRGQFFFGFIKEAYTTCGYKYPGKFGKRTKDFEKPGKGNFHAPVHVIRYIVVFPSVFNGKKKLKVEKNSLGINLVLDGK